MEELLMTQGLVKVMVDTVKNPERLNFSAEGKDVDAYIRKDLLGMVGLKETNFTARDFDKAMRRNGLEVFEIIEEALQHTFLQGIDENALYNMFAEVRNMALGDTPEFVLGDDGIVTVSEISNGNWDIRRQKLEGGKSFFVQVKTYGAKMYQDFFAFALGRITFQEMITRVAQGFDHHLSKLVAGAFSDTVDVLPAELKVDGSLDLDELQKLYARVEAMAGSATVVGTRAALAKITAGADAQWVTEEQKSNMQRTGNIGYYQGMTLVQLPQVLKDGTFDFAYDDDKLLVLPASEQAKPIKIVVEGDGAIREATVQQDNQDQTLEYTYTTEYGVNVIIDTAFGIYEITK